jgi:hypothetical protein
MKLTPKEISAGRGLVAKAGGMREFQRQLKAAPRRKRGQRGDTFTVDAGLGGLQSFCDTAKREWDDHPEPREAIRRHIDHIHRALGDSLFREKFGASVDVVRDRLYRKMKAGKFDKWKPPAGIDPAKFTFKKLDPDLK